MVILGCVEKSGYDFFRLQVSKKLTVEPRRIHSATPSPICVECGFSKAERLIFFGPDLYKVSAERLEFK